MSEKVEVTKEDAVYVAAILESILKDRVANLIRLRNQVDYTSKRFPLSQECTDIDKATIANEESFCNLIRGVGKRFSEAAGVEFDGWEME